MTEEENFVDDMLRTGRVLATAVGQFRERHARAEIEYQRDREAEASRTEREAEQARRDAIEAARTSYQDVSRWDWSAPDINHRVGEAMVASAAMLEHDHVAKVAQRRVVAEVRARHGAGADEWMAAAIARWQELTRETVDQDASETDQAIAREQLEDQAEAAATHAADQARGRAVTEELTGNQEPAHDQEAEPTTATTERPRPQTEVEQAVEITHQGHPEQLDLQRAQTRGRARNTNRRRARHTDRSSAADRGRER